MTPINARTWFGKSVNGNLVRHVIDKVFQLKWAGLRKDYLNLSIFALAALNLKAGTYGIYCDTVIWLFFDHPSIKLVV